jgi:hypothetical protein
MTLDHAWPPSGTAFRGLTGEMPGRLPAQGGGCSLLTLGLDPGPPRFSSLWPYPAGTGPGRRAGRFTVIRCPRLAGLPRTALNGLRTRHRAHYWGENPEKAVLVVSGRGEWLGFAAGGGSPALPAVVPPARGI